MAFDHCKPSADDQQVRICTYSPTQRYAVVGLVGFPVDLKFGDGEHIKRHEFAYTGLDKDGNPSPTWRGPGLATKGAATADAGKPDLFKTNLPIWPYLAGHSALVVVTMLPDGGERTYLFDLAAQRSEDCTGTACDGTTSALEFTYPTDKAAAASKETDEKRQAAVAAWQARQARQKEDTAVARLRTDAFYGPRSFAYQAKSDPKYRFLAPTEVSDNGWLTEMQWPENIQSPSVTIIDPVSGEERIVPVSQQGHMQIISTTAEWFRLRLGPKAVMDVHNLAWSPNRPNPETGTTSPDVVRTVIYQDAKK
jgi:type IV secretory pathway VirB9-like protein